jgi:NAD(P)-dependent dehydrogenase (short-subunit alcohol dehydrogenase family)
MSPSTSSDREGQPSSYAGRLVFVAGGASGIGEGIAGAYAQSGARLAIADVDFVAARSAADRLREQGIEAIGLPLDVVDPTAWRDALDAAEARLGPLALLCNSAGIVGAGKPLTDIPFARFARLFDITVNGVLHGVQAAVPRMRAGGGHVVTVASMASLTAIPTLGDYSTAKAALLGLTDALAAELEGSGVGVSIVFPGFVRTRLRETTAAVLGEPSPQALAAPAAPGMEPDQVGRIVRDAVAAGERYVFTHAERRGAVAAHFEAVLRGFDRLLPAT